MNPSGRKRILISIDWFVPGYKAGGPIRSCVNFAYAMREEYDIYVLTGDRDFGDYEPYEDIPRNTWTEHDQHIQVYYADPHSINLRFWRKILSELQPDFVYLNNLFSGSFCFLPLMAKKSTPESKWILAPRGMLHKGAFQYKSFKKKLYISAIKALGLSRQLYFQATDEQEKQDIEKFFHPKLETSVISNLPFSRLSEPVKRAKEQGNISAVFFSRISPKKNLDFFLDMLEDFQGSIDLDIIGPIENPDYWEYCKKKAQEVGVKLRMTYLGVFPHEEVMERLNAYHLFVLPTHGENFGHAIFEAFLSACPVLVSDQTPWRDLEEQQAGWDISLDNTQRFKEVIQEIANMDHETWSAWSIASWNYGKQYLQNSKSIAQYAELFSH